jgi:transcriptional regulator with XRE-family HTH domain
MITNERQYKITKAQVEKFKQALDLLRKEGVPGNDNARMLYRVQEEALKSQTEDLEEELREYESLKKGEFQIEELEAFSSLSESLIKARISSGLTQKDLANIINVHEQQIQRYEATKYQTASLARIIEIAKALGIQNQMSLIPAGTKLSVDLLFQKLNNCGISRDFMFSRIVPSNLLSALNEGAKEEQENALIKISSIVGRVFGWKQNDIWSKSDLTISHQPAISVSYKLPNKVEEKKLSIYTIYAHYLSMLVLDVTSHLNTKPIPSTSNEICQAIKKEYGEMNFEFLLRYVWSLGIPVLPLNDSGAFHGACWRENKRNVIVLKQKNQLEARWFYDLLHELYHASVKPDDDQFAHTDIEDGVDIKKKAVEDQAANMFAGDIALEGRAEELIQECVTEANGNIPFLKKALPRVAERENVSVGLLANYMAFRLSLEGQNWWGTADNLQVSNKQSLQIARNVFLENVDLKKINEIDRQILIQTLSD